MIVGIALAVASASYLCNVALGTLVATHRVDSSGFHWLHHALYICTFALTVAAVAAGFWRQPLVGWMLLPTVVPFAAIPFLGTRGARHPIADLVPAPFYLAALAALIS